MRNAGAARPEGSQNDAEEASLDERMPGALAVLATDIRVPEAARRRAVDIIEALVTGEEPTPPSGQRRVPFTSSA